MPALAHMCTSSTVHRYSTATWPLLVFTTRAHSLPPLSDHTHPSSPRLLTRAARTQTHLRLLELHNAGLNDPGGFGLEGRRKLASGALAKRSHEPTVASREPLEEFQPGATRSGVGRHTGTRTRTRRARVHTHLRTHTYAHTHTHRTFQPGATRSGADKHTGTRTRTHARAHTHTHRTNTHIHTYIHTDTHTLTHTYSLTHIWGTRSGAGKHIYYIHMYIHTCI